MINNSTIDIVIRQLGKILKHKDEVKQIIVYIDSLGGSLDNTYKIRDLLSPYRNIITTVALSFCESAAVFLYLFGTKRYIIKDCIFMVHRPCYIIKDFCPNDERITIPFLEYRLKELKKDEKSLKKTLKEGNFPNDFIDDLFKNDKDLIIPCDYLIKWGVATSYCDVNYVPIIST